MRAFVRPTINKDVNSCLESKHFLCILLMFPRPARHFIKVRLSLFFGVFLAHSDCQHLSCFDQTLGPLQSSSPPKQCTIRPAGASEPWEAQCQQDLYIDIHSTHANKDISLSHVSCLCGSLLEPDTQTLRKVFN